MQYSQWHFLSLNEERSFVVCRKMDVTGDGARLRKMTLFFHCGSLVSHTCEITHVSHGSRGKVSRGTEGTNVRGRGQERRWEVRENLLTIIYI